MLRTYLETSPRNALYTSKTIQNEIISVLGSAIQDHLIQEIKAAKFYSILADEVTDCANLEQVSLVIRFVDSNKHIREEFLDFIAWLMLSWLKAHDLRRCFSRLYDGASNMSSSTVGVQAQICEASPLALYTHCQSHQLNLCIAKACSLLMIRNANGVISEVAKFFNDLPKHQHFLSM